MRPRSWLILALLGISPSLSSLAVSSDKTKLVNVASQPKGRMRLGETIKDFGVIKRGEKVSYDFAFTNEGEGPLVIQGVHASCGCTAAEAEAGRVYEPGDKGVIRVTVDSTDFRGNFAKPITVMTNEKLLPARTLTVKAKIEEEVTAEPPMIDFGNVVATESAIKTVVVKPIKKGLDLAIKKLRFNEKALKVAYVKEAENWVLTIELAKDLPPGFLAETIYVVNNSQALPELPVLVRANIVGGITYKPNYVEFGAIPAKDRAVRTVHFSGSDPGFSVAGAKAEIIINGKRAPDVEQFVKIAASEPDVEGQRNIAVELKNVGAMAGSVHGKLHFETSNPKQKDVTIDFYAFFQEE